MGGSLGVSVSSVTASQAKGTESNGPSPAQGKDKTPVPVPHNTLTAGATYLGHDKAQANHATLGLGHIVVGGTTLTDDNAVHPGLGDLNRDLNLAQEITKDNDVGGLNFVTTVDLRWFSPEGREDMLKEQKAAAGGMVLAGMDLLTVGKVAGKVITNEVVLADAGKVLAGTLDQLHGVNTYVMGNAAGAAQIEAHANGESGDLTATQAATNALTQSVNGDSTRLVSSGTIAGAHDSLTGANYINAGLTDSYVSTVGHEMAHSYTRSESIADYMGWATDVIWSTGVWANSAAIAANRPINLNTSLLQQQNAMLLQQNNAQFGSALAEHGYAFDFREIFTFRGTDGIRVLGDSYPPGQTPIGATPVLNTSTMLASPEQRAIAERINQSNAAIAEVTGSTESCAQLKNCVSPNLQSGITMDVLGIKAENLSLRNPAAEVGDEVHQYRQIGASLETAIKEFDAGTQLVASLTAAKTAFDATDWLFSTSLEDKAGALRGLYSTIVEYPGTTGVLLATVGMLSHGTSVVSTEIRAGQVPNSNRLAVSGERYFNGGLPAIEESPYSPSAVNARSAEFYDFYGDGNLMRGAWDNLEVRTWYKAEDELLPSYIDQSLPLELQAKQGFDMRNINRDRARELMYDRASADRLYREEPNREWNSFIRYQESKGLQGDDVYLNILKTMTKTRAEVNKLYDLD